LFFFLNLSIKFKDLCKSNRTLNKPFIDFLILLNFPLFSSNSLLFPYIILFIYFFMFAREMISIEICEHFLCIQNCQCYVHYYKIFSLISKFLGLNINLQSIIINKMDLIWRRNHSICWTWIVNVFYDFFL